MASGCARQGRTLRTIVKVGRFSSVETKVLRHRNRMPLNVFAIVRPHVHGALGDAAAGGSGDALSDGHQRRLATEAILEAGDFVTPRGKQEKT
jgi:hypothetical protein